MLWTDASRRKARPVASCGPARRAWHAKPWHSALLAVAALVSCGRAPDPTRTVLTSVRQVRQLSPSQIGLAPARIRGILTYYDGNSGFCLVQDSTGGIRVSLAARQVLPAPGWRVEVAGLVSSQGTAPAIVGARVTALGADTLPPPVSVSAARLQDPEYEYKRVVLPGVVQSVASERPGLVTLEIRARNATLRKLSRQFLIVACKRTERSRGAGEERITKWRKRKLRTHCWIWWRAIILDFDASWNIPNWLRR